MTGGGRQLKGRGMGQEGPCRRGEGGIGQEGPWEGGGFMIGPRAVITPSDGL